jgi:putative endonuclease
MNTIELGRSGEDLAAEYLDSTGMRILARNWRSPTGEIDIVAVDGRCLVICEVKTRSSTRAGEPVEAVTPEKVRRLRRLAAAWLGSRGGARPRTVRIDVVAIWWPRNAAPVIRHLKGVG